MKQCLFNILFFLLLISYVNYNFFRFIQKLLHIILSHHTVYQIFDLFGTQLLFEQYRFLQTTK